MSNKEKISKEYLDKVMVSENEIAMFSNLFSRRLKDLLYEMSLYHGCDISIYRHLDPLSKDVEGREDQIENYYMYFYQTLVIDIDKPDMRFIYQAGAIHPKQIEENVYRDIVSYFLSMVNADIEEL